MHPARLIRALLVGLAVLGACAPAAAANITVTPGAGSTVVTSSAACGADLCTTVRIGIEGNNYYHGGNCTVYTHTASIKIATPARVKSAVVSRITEDDYVQLSMSGGPTGGLVWWEPSSWTGTAYPGSKCETKRTRTVYPNTNFLNFVNTTLPVTATLRVAVGGDGEGWAILSFVERKAVCSDGIDNDGDGKTDYPADIGCTSADDDDEKNTQQCSDGIDNDGDGLVDFPTDPGCTSAADTDEFNIVACNDGIDNDGDGLIDFPADIGCFSAHDTNEYNPKNPACRDGIDNDGDGKTDFPADSGCSDANDDGEADWPGNCTANCVCAADQDGSGDAESANEHRSCDMHSGKALCPLDRAMCDSRTIDIYDPSTGTTHQEIQRSCPLDPDSPCINTGSGGYMCSKDPCFDSTKLVPTDVNPEAEQPANNGPTDANGNCLGLIRIFPGNGARCRKSGTQTAYQNCCGNKLGKMQDTQGKAGQAPQKDYKEEATSIEFWDNQCDIQDQTTAKLADSGYCISLGSYCAEKWPLVGCVQRAQSYCCFNSQLSRLIQEQGRAQLPAMGGFGSPESPQCRGFSPEEFQALDFSKMDLSSYYATIQTQAQGVMQSNMQNKVQGQINNGP